MNLNTTMKKHLTNINWKTSYQIIPELSRSQRSIKTEELSIVKSWWRHHVIYLQLFFFMKIFLEGDISILSGTGTIWVFVSWLFFVRLSDVAPHHAEDREESVSPDEATVTLGRSMWYTVGRLSADRGSYDDFLHGKGVQESLHWMGRRLWLMLP